MKKRGFAYRGVNFKPTDVPGDGNFLFYALVLSECIPFNDHIELCKYLLGRMINVLQDDSDICIILKDFFKYKRCLDKQGWTDEFITNKFNSILIYLVNQEFWQVTLRMLQYIGSMVSELFLFPI